MYLWFLFLHFVVVFSMHASSSSSRDEQIFGPDVYKYVSTKTDYETVRGKLKRPNPNCKPIQIWSILRHGTRYTGINEVPKFLSLKTIRDEIVKNHKEGRGSLSFGKLHYLSKWRPDSQLDQKFASKLSRKGRIDAHNLGERVRQMFPELTTNPANGIDPQNYVFRTTNTERTNETLKAFAEGFFNKLKVIEPEITEETSHIIQPYRNCPAWEADPQGLHFNDERNKLARGPPFQKFLRDITARLGYTSLMHFDLVNLIYGLCRYEMAWKPEKPSAWCTIFTREEMKLFEFMEDLSYYHNCGPGRLMSGLLGCFLLKDMFKYFTIVESMQETQHPKGIFYVGHTLSVQMLLMALKVDFDQKPLKASDYKDSEDRLYRTSLQAPFLANLMAVFYKCEGERKQNKVMFYLNENPFVLKYCHSELCDWDSLKKKFQPDIDGCSLRICQSRRK